MRIDSHQTLHTRSKATLILLSLFTFFNASSPSLCLAALRPSPPSGGCCYCPSSRCLRNTCPPCCSCTLSPCCASARRVPRAPFHCGGYHSSPCASPCVHGGSPCGPCTLEAPCGPKDNELNRKRLQDFQHDKVPNIKQREVAGLFLYACHAIHLIESYEKLSFCRFELSFSFRAKNWG